MSTSNYIFVIMVYLCIIKSSSTAEHEAMRLTSMKRKGSFSCMRLSMPQRTSWRRAWSWQILKMFFWIAGPLVSQWVRVHSRSLMMKLSTLAFMSSSSLLKHASESSMNFYVREAMRRKRGWASSGRVSADITNGQILTCCVICVIFTLFCLSFSFCSWSFFSAMLYFLSTL